MLVLSYHFVVQFSTSPKTITIIVVLLRLCSLFTSVAEKIMLREAMWWLHHKRAGRGRVCEFLNLYNFIKTFPCLPGPNCGVRFDLNLPALAVPPACNKQTHTHPLSISTQWAAVSVACRPYRFLYSGVGGVRWD